MTETRWLDEREQSAWRAFLSMHARLMAQLGRELQEELGLSHADFEHGEVGVLVRLSEHEGSRMRILELARSLDWEKSRLSHQLTRMQQRSLVERDHCSEDRRGAFVKLTDAGRDAITKAAPLHVDGVRRYLFDEVSAEQIDQLGTLARTVLERLDAECTGRDGTCAPDTECCD